MNYFVTAQYMAAAAFWSVAMIHALVWLRSRREIVHLLFALTAAAAGAGAVTEAAMYQSMDLDSMAVSLRSYVAASGGNRDHGTVFYLVLRHGGPIRKNVGWCTDSGFLDGDDPSITFRKPVFCTRN